MKPEAGVTLDVGRHINSTLSHHLALLLLHPHAGEKQEGAAGGDDDVLVLVGVEGDAGAVLLLRLITILERAHAHQPKLLGGGQWVSTT